MVEYEPTKEEIEGWAQGLDEVQARIARRFVRAEP